MPPLPHRTAMLQRVSAVNALVDALRDEVLDGSLTPGAPLREAELCHAFGVSRHTVRAALQALSHEGLARIVANRGAFVRELTSEDVVDLFRLRAVLEAAAAEQLAAARSACTEPLRDAVAALAAMPPDADWRAMRDADLAVHRALVSTMGSTRIDRTYAALMTELRICFRELKPSLEDHAEVARQHREILDAIEAHEPQAATCLVREHLDESCRDVLAAYGAPCGSMTD